ncbi:hypothetical protein ACK3TF_000855 [Chlorella vulgaris]
MTQGVFLVEHELQHLGLQLVLAAFLAFSRQHVLRSKNRQPHCHSGYLQTAAQDPVYGAAAVFVFRSLRSNTESPAGCYAPYLELVWNINGKSGMHQDGDGYKYYRTITRFSIDPDSDVGGLAISITKELLGHGRPVNQQACTQPVPALRRRARWSW